MEAILALVLSILLGAFALPVAKTMVLAWNRLITSCLTQEELERQREEFAADLECEIDHHLSIGHKPVEIAAIVLVRNGTAAAGDIAVALPPISAVIRDRLARGSASVRSVKTPTKALAMLSLLGLMNWAYFTSEDHSLIQGLLFNIFGVGIATAIHFDHKLWVRTVLNWGLGIVSSLGAGCLVWVVFQNRLYEFPQFYEILLVLLAMAVGAWLTLAENRARLFGGHWWPVFPIWGAIFGASLLTSQVLTGSFNQLLEAWSSLGLTLLMLMLFLAIWATVTWICSRTWRGGVWAVAGAMRLTAAGIRHIR